GGEDGVHDGRHSADLGVRDRRGGPLGRGLVEPAEQGVHPAEVLQVAAEEVPGVPGQVSERLAGLPERDVQFAERPRQGPASPPGSRWTQWPGSSSRARPNGPSRWYPWTEST